jgi:adenine phosphoribosyltransferase
VSTEALDLDAYIRDVPDFPRPGIVFKDATPLLLHPPALEAAIDGVVGLVGPREVDLVVAAEARGFILGGALAARLGAGFIPARKPGKLPRVTDAAEYVLEYGVDALEVHRDALEGGARVVVHDDLLATGGTAAALCELVRRAGAEVVCCAFLIELAFLGGRAALGDVEVASLLRVERE